MHVSFEFYQKRKTLPHNFTSEHTPHIRDPCNFTSMKELPSHGCHKYGEFLRRLLHDVLCDSVTLTRHLIYEFCVRCNSGSWIIRCVKAMQQHVHVGNAGCLAKGSAQRG